MIWLALALIAGALLLGLLVGLYLDRRCSYLQKQLDETNERLVEQAAKSNDGLIRYEVRVDGLKTQVAELEDEVIGLLKPKGEL